ncbi:glycoside hydrolase family protein [Lysobacter sp. F6437]|uniref:glycoside hydrolase family protein n=1 Tax=Lysobacter sp. F6437 TaxID=3459296 RepID=UPI00403DF1E2
MSGNGVGIQSSRSSARGAGLTEYLIVVAGISLAAAATFGAFGDTIRHQTAGMALELAGLDSGNAIAGAVASAGRATDAAAAGGPFFGGGGGGAAGGGGPGAGGGGAGAGGGGVDPSLPYQPPGSGGSGGAGSGGGGSSGPPPVMCVAAASGGGGPQAASATCDSEMALSDEGATWLKDVETLALQPYDDQVGITDEPITEWVEGATIGYGHLILKSQWDTYKDGITEEEADALFLVDAEPFIDAVNGAITVEVEQHEFDAMVIMAFNIGEEGFKSSSVAKLVNDPEATTPYASLEDAWKAWNKSQGKINQGVINRREAEWDMYSQGIYRHW